MIGISYNTSRLFVSYARERASVPRMPAPCGSCVKKWAQGLDKMR